MTVISKRYSIDSNLKKNFGKEIQRKTIKCCVFDL